MQNQHINSLTKLGWKQDGDRWVSPDTKIDYDLEQALRIAGIKTKIRVGNVAAWLAGLPHVSIIDTRDC